VNTPDVLYLKLYAPRSFEDQLIAGPLRSLGEFATGAGLSDGWFFLRYTDPEPHLRVRFHGEPAALLGPLLREVSGWAGELVADGVCTRFAFDTYERAVERYGGEQGVRAAEAVFIADSLTIARILDLSRRDALPCDQTTVAVLSVDDLLAGLGLDAEERARVYRDAAPPSRRDGKEYRRRKGELRRLLGRPEALAQAPGGGALSGLLAARRVALPPTAALLGSLEQDQVMRRPRAQLCCSYLHMHLNRLFGTDPPHEQLVLQLLRRTREGLRRAPLA
jgi:thiopeptide-type bacteriocin biosynthesis protein